MQNFLKILLCPMELASLLLSMFSKSTKIETSSLSWVEKNLALSDPTKKQYELWLSEELIQEIGGSFSILKELVAPVSNKLKYTTEKLTSFSVLDIFSSILLL